MAPTAEYPVRGRRSHRPRFGGALLTGERGAASVLVAVCLSALMISGAVAVDVGSIYLNGRRLQGMADLAAMSAVQNLTNAQAAANGEVALNPWPGPVVAQVVTGVYTPDPQVAAASRFQPDPSAPSAVQVTLTGQTPLIFLPLVLGRSTVSLKRTAIAARAQLASFSIGSRLAAVQGGVANSLLSALTGSQVQLSVADYNALIGAKLDLFQYLGALKTRASLQGDSYSQVLSASVPTSTVLSALADVLTSNGNAAAAAAVQSLAAASGGMGMVQLSSLFGLGPYLNQDHVTSGSASGIWLGAMDFSDEVLMLANGQHQLSFDLGAVAPGLADVKAWLAVGQRASQSPWMAVASSGSVVITTPQARVYLDARAAPAGSLLSAGVATVDIPLYVQLASAQASLAGDACSPQNDPTSVTLSATPSLGELAIGQVAPSALSDFTTPVPLAPAPLVNLGLLTASASAEVNLGGASPQTVVFSAGDIQAMTVKTVSTGDAAQATAASLLAGTSVQVQTLGLDLGLNRSLLSAGFQSTLTTAAPALDQVLDTLENLSGAQLGQADVWVDGMRCNGAALVG